MTDYKKLVKALLSASTVSTAFEKLMLDAAVAIEGLQAEVKILKVSGREAYFEGMAADANGRQVEKLAKRNAELHAELEKWVSAAEDSGRQIEELQAEVKRLKPKQRKLGRWEKAKPKGVVTYSDGYAECSSCHEAIWLGWGMNFCPNCGVQNRIIDPDDYDGAKMNDSNALNALDNAQDGPIITPCRGCSDYDGYGGCNSKGGCARAKMEVQDG